MENLFVVCETKKSTKNSLISYPIIFTYVVNLRKLQCKVTLI